MKYTELIKAANEAKEHSYSPYSNFKVGAAVLGKNGKIYAGANIENSSYGASLCAERLAVSKAIFDGERAFVAISISCSNPEITCYPCGICRQYLSEFGDMDIVLLKNGKSEKAIKLSKLLPNNFGAKDLKK